MVVSILYLVLLYRYTYTDRGVTQLCLPVENVNNEYAETIPLHSRIVRIGEKENETGETGITTLHLLILGMMTV